MLKKVNKIIFGISLLSAFILLIMLLLLDMIPTKYLFVVVMFFILVYAVFGLFSIKLKNKIGLCVLLVFELIFAILSVFASDKIYETNDFIEALNRSKKEEIIYYVMVNKESAYNHISDIEKKDVGTYFANDKNEQAVLKKLSQEVTTAEKKYNNLSKMGEDLLNKNIDAILMSGFQKELLTERLETFSKRTKVLYKIKLSIKKQKKETSNIDITKDPFSIYISGIDTAGAINTVSRSDVNIVLTVNPKTNEILLTSIPRDYYVSLHGIKEPKDKLTHAGLYGIDTSMSTIEDLLNIKLDYYVRVNFDTLVNVVDTIGGVDVYSDRDFKTYKGYIKKGVNHLNGEEALAFSRERKSFAEGDRKRGEHQEEVIRAIINKVSSSTVMLTNYSSILNSLSGSFETSLPAEKIKQFVKFQMNQMKPWAITTKNLDGTGSSAYTYSIPNENLYVMIPDEKTVVEASSAIKALKEKRAE